MAAATVRVLKSEKKIVVLDALGEGKFSGRKRGSCHVAAG
jgi:hypothetical protein